MLRILLIIFSLGVTHIAADENRPDFFHKAFSEAANEQNLLLKTLSVLQAQSDTAFHLAFADEIKVINSSADFYEFAEEAKRYPYSSSPHQTNFLNSQDLSEFFTLFNHANLNQIEVNITQSEWDAMLAELSNNLKSDKYFTANVNITTASGTTQITDVGFRIRGNTTRVIPEINGVFQPAHFKLKFNETFDMADDTLPYLVRKERRYANLRALNLKNRKPGYDDSQMR